MRALVSWQCEQPTQAHSELDAFIHLWQKGDFEIQIFDWTYEYITDLLLCQLSRPLRSSDSSLMCIPRIRAKHGVLASSFFTPLIWNELSENCKNSENTVVFNWGKNPISLELLLINHSWKIINWSLCLNLSSFYFESAKHSHYGLLSLLLQTPRGVIWPSKNNVYQEFPDRAWLSTCPELTESSLSYRCQSVLSN